MSLGKDERSRARNLAMALRRLREKLEKKVYRAPPRTKTKPTRASKRRRLDSKRLLSAKKASRRGLGE